MISRRGLLAGLGALVLPVPGVRAEGVARSLRPVRRGGQPRPDLPSPADLIAAARLGGVTGFVLLDARTGAVIEAEGEGVEVPPASVAKVITALFALDRLGPEFRFTTRVMAGGPLQAGRVAGDLVLAGAGDPTLDTDRLGDLAGRLAAAGLRGIDGQFLAEAGALPEITRIAEGQPVQVGYNPAISGLNLNFNRVHFEWRRGGGDWRLAMDARGERFVPEVALARVRVAQRDSPLFTFEQAGGEERWTVADAALGEGGSRWLPVRQPALYTGEVFRTLAAAQGIALPAATVQRGGAVPGWTEIGADQSPPLDQMLRDMLRFSTNLTAEAIGLRASGAGTLAGSGRAMAEWAAMRLGVRAHHADHSGLGAASRVTPGGMARALVAGLATPTGRLLPQILRDVKMRDAEGEALEASPIRVVAKSGTLNFVSGLAGLIAPPGRPALVFAVFSADQPRRAALSIDEREDPPGGAAWTRRARALQGRLIHRWGTLYG